MKKLVLTVMLLMVFCSTALGAEITADDAFRIASQPTDDPIIGVWRMHHTINTFRGEITHLAIVPNTTDRREGWPYLGIMLEDGFQMRRGGVVMALNHTDVSYIYDVVITTKGDILGIVDAEGAGAAFLLPENVLDMSRIIAQSRGGVLSIDTAIRVIAGTFSIDTVIRAPISHMVKVQGFQMKSDGTLARTSGLTFDGLMISAADPNGLAYQADLRSGDTILEINGRAADQAMLRDIDARLAAGRSVTIQYERNRQRNLVTLRNNNPRTS